MKQIIRIFVWGLFLNAIGCTPVNQLTRVTKTPKIYTQNFCCEPKIKRYFSKRTPWIVYSQQDQNPTFHHPAGKVILKKATYMEAFLVIAKKGEYLQLIKYAPDIIEKNSLKNRKQIQYYGWIHQDKVVPSSHALTDIASGRTHKMITSIKNEKTLENTEKFFSQDSLILYKEPQLINPIHKIALHAPVYLYKKNNDRSKSLVFAKSLITPENASQIVSGWTSSSLIMPYGLSFYSNLSQMPIEKITLTDASKKDSLQDSSVAMASQETFVSLRPILSLEQKEKSVQLNTQLPVSVIDNDANYIYALSGNAITYKQFKEIQQQLKQINIIFAFENQPSVVALFEALVVSINQLKNQLPSQNQFQYRIGAVVGFAQQYNALLEIPLSDDLDATLKKLEQVADNKSKRTPSQAISWRATLRACQMLSKYKNENNLIVVVGENGNDKEHIDNHLIDNIVAAKARLLGYQLYSDAGNRYNNFILQIQDIIERSTQEITKKKKDILVHSQQLRPANRFIERNQNVYSLDFPKQSMWQGWMLFPKKKEQIAQDVFITAVDSLITEIQLDSQNIIEQLQTSFSKSGMSRSSINPLWASLQHLSKDYMPPSSFAKPFSREPYTFFPASVQIEKQLWAKQKHFLLLSQEELLFIQDFLSDMTKEQVDYTYATKNSKKKEQTKKKSLLEDDGSSDFKNTHEQAPQYINTRKVRKSLQKSYYKWVKINKVAPHKKRQIQKMSLAKATQEAIWYPSNSLILQQYNVKDIRDKKKLSDKELDQLIEYFIRKKQDFEQNISPENQIHVHGEIFYKIATETLP